MAEDNPDYAGPEATALRAEANKYGDERHKLFDAANAAFTSGDKAKAKQLSEQGEQLQYLKLSRCSGFINYFLLCCFVQERRLAGNLKKLTRKLLLSPSSIATMVTGTTTWTCMAYILLKLLKL